MAVLWNLQTTPDAPWLRGTSLKNQGLVSAEITEGYCPSKVGRIIELASYAL